MYNLLVLSEAAALRSASARWLPYLLLAHALVRVVQLVGDDVAVAGERLVPAQGDGGRRVGRGLKVGGRTRNLDCGRQETKSRG